MQIRWKNVKGEAIVRQVVELFYIIPVKIVFRFFYD